jgi:hypothetical protein
MTMTVKITWDLSTVTFCIDLSMRIVKKTPKVGPRLIFPDLIISCGGEISAACSLPGEENTAGTVGALDAEHFLIAAHFLADVLL